MAGNAGGGYRSRFTGGEFHVEETAARVPSQASFAWLGIHVASGNSVGLIDKEWVPCAPGSRPAGAPERALSLPKGGAPSIHQLQNCLMRSTCPRDLPHHAAAFVAVPHASGIRRAVKIAVRVEHRGAVRFVAVTTAEVVEIDQGARFAAIRQLVDPAIPMGAVIRTHPKKMTGCVHAPFEGVGTDNR